jgi:ABC-type nitrate/sulfonate/bicarbonate transport system substrate-binding protein
MFPIDRMISLGVRKGLQILLGATFGLTCPLTAAGAELGGKLEKAAVSIAYVSPSAAFTPLFVAAEAGLFSKYGLNVKSQLLGPAVPSRVLLPRKLISS